MSTGILESPVVVAPAKPVRDFEFLKALTVTSYQPGPVDALEACRRIWDAAAGQAARLFDIPDAVGLIRQAAWMSLCQVSFQIRAIIADTDEAMEIGFREDTIAQRITSDMNLLRSRLP